MNVNKEMYSRKRFDRRNQKPAKDKEQLFHFKRRFRERTGCGCNVRVLESIYNQIHNDALVIIGDQSNRLRMYEYFYNSEKYAIVYDRKRKNLVTILFIDDEFLFKNEIIYRDGEYIDARTN